MEAREELTDLPCIFAVFFRLKYTFFKNWCLFGERGALDFLMESSIIPVELFSTSHFLLSLYH